MVFVYAVITRSFKEDEDFQVLGQKTPAEPESGEPAAEARTQQPYGHHDRAEVKKKKKKNEEDAVRRLREKEDSDQVTEERRE